MKNLTILFLLVIVSFQNPVFGSDDKYNLKTIEEKAIPKGKLLALWNDVALNMCNEENDYFGTTKEQCQGDINKKKSACVEKQNSDLNKLISTKIESHDMGRVYLNCVSPYFYCHGVEVKNMKQAKEQCK